jgi:hypothetical protein
MRQFNRGLVMLALGLPLGTVSATGTDCSAVTPSFGLVRQTTSLDPPGPFVDGYVFGGDFEDGPPLTQWADLFGSPFPTRSGNAQARIQTGKFVALALETSTLGDPIYAGMDYGVIRTFAAAAYTGNLAMAFSECPGDFLNPVEGSSFCRLQTGQGAFSWWLAGTSPFTCQLAENTTYYFNMAYVDLSTGLPNCAGTSDGICNVFLESR